MYCVYHLYARYNYTILACILLLHYIFLYKLSIYYMLYTCYIYTVYDITHYITIIIHLPTLHSYILLYMYRWAAYFPYFDLSSPPTPGSVSVAPVQTPVPDSGRKFIIHPDTWVRAYEYSKIEFKAEDFFPRHWHSIHVIV